MVKKIVTYPTPPSVNYSTDVRVVDEDIKNLIQDIKDTITANDLDGLAAFQIGSMYNIVVIKKEDSSFLELINPRVIGSTTEKITTVEKTAYFPGLSAKVTRDANVSIIYEDINMQQHSLRAEGDEAILLQRKIDYTFGSSFINKLSPDEKKRFEKKLEFGSDIAISEHCPTTFNRDKILKVINIAMVAMVVLLISSFFTESNFWDYQLYTSLGVLGLTIIYFFYAQYEGAKYTSCTSCQIGNIIGTTIITLSKLTIIMIASYFLM
jgi:peptide deformylase